MGQYPGAPPQLHGLLLTLPRYVPNNRPRVPPFKISDDLSESSSEDEEEIDEVRPDHLLRPRAAPRSPL